MLIQIAPEQICDSSVEENVMFHLVAKERKGRNIKSLITILQIPMPLITQKASPSGAQRLAIKRMRVNTYISVPHVADEI